MLVCIAKARKPRDVRTAAQRAEFRQAQALSERMGSAVRANLLRGISTFRDTIDPEDLARALRSGRSGGYAGLVDHLPWDTLENSLEPMQGTLAEAAERSGRRTITTIAPPKRGFRYDLKNPAIKGYIKTRTGELITTLKQGMLEAVRTSTARALTHALTPQQVADEIRGAIGLNARQASALARYRSGLAQQGVSTQRIGQLATRRENQLLDQRAIMIARTEVRFAANAGQQAVWQAAQKEGLIPNDAKRRWIVDGDPCPELCRPMADPRRGVVGINEPWTLPDGRRVDNPTESHPHCYCIASIEY